MCVTGTNNIANISTGVSVGATIVVGSLLVAGTLIGFYQGFHARAIGLIVSAGAIAIPGAIGTIVLFRVTCLEYKEVERVTKLFKEVHSNDDKVM